MPVPEFLRLRPSEKNWGIGEMAGHGDTETRGRGDRGMESWKDGEIGRWGDREK